MTPKNTPKRLDGLHRSSASTRLRVTQPSVSKQVTLSTNPVATQTKQAAATQAKKLRAPITTAPRRLQKPVIDRPADKVSQARKTMPITPAVRGLRVAIVHDWLIGGGAELVVEQLHYLFPEAPIYTSYCDPTWRSRLHDKVKTGYLQWWPLAQLRKFIPTLRWTWFERLDLSGYDLVISSSGAEAKGVRVLPTAMHINYCHAPTHYYWSKYDEYLRHPGFGALDWFARLGLRLLVSPLRKRDYKAAQRPDYIIANSTYIKNQIQQYYDRSAIVIHPPVSLERFHSKAPHMRKGFIISGRQTPYKRFDLAVAACTRLNLPLTVIGDGPDHARLRKLAGPTVTFLGRASDEVLAEEFARAQALIFPGTDDFGITAVEALAAGTPVIAYKAGGALDYVTLGKTGLFFEEPTVDSLVTILEQFPRYKFDHTKITQSAQAYSREQFRQTMTLLINKVIAGHTTKA